MARKSNKTATLTSSVGVIDNSVVETVEQIDAQVVENIQVAAAVAVQVESKAAKTRTILARELEKVEGDFSKLVRKDVIAAFKAEAGLTQAGAATYYQQLRDKAGFVNHKAA